MLKIGLTGIQKIWLNFPLEIGILIWNSKVTTEVWSKTSSIKLKVWIYKGMAPQFDSDYSEIFQFQVFVFVLYLANPETQEFRPRKNVIY